MRKFSFQVLPLALVALLSCGLAHALTTDVSLTATAPATVTPGANIIYTITVANSAGGATGVVLTVPIPANTTFVSTGATPAGWGLPNNTGASISYTHTSLPANSAAASNTFTVTVMSGPALASGVVISCAPSVALTGGNTDSNTANNTVTRTTTTTTPICDVSVSISNGTNPAFQLSQRSFQVTVANSGPSTCVTPSFQIINAPGTTYQSVTFTSGINNTGTTIVSGGVGQASTVRVNLNNITPGLNSVHTYVENITASAPNSVTDTVTVASATTSDSSAGNNTATSTFTVNPPACDLTIAITAGTNPVNAGQSVRTYTVTVNNVGGIACAAPEFTINSPAGTAFSAINYVSGVTQTGIIITDTSGNPGGGVGIPSRVRVTLNSMNTGANSVFTYSESILANATPGTNSITDTAVASSPVTAESNTSNNTATSAFTVNQVADIGITMTSSNATTVAAGSVASGDLITYTVTLTNAGPSSAGTTVVTSLTPTNTTFVSAAQTSGPTGFVLATTAADAKFTHPNYDVGAVATFNLVYRVGPALAAGVIISHTATSATTATNAAGNDSQNISRTTVIASDIGVSLISAQPVSPATVVAGSNLTYALTIINNGPSNTGAAVTFTDLVPANTTFVSLTNTSGQVFTLTVPPTGGPSGTTAAMAAGVSSVYSLVVKIDTNAPPGTVITNTLTATCNTDPTLPNSASITHTVAQEANLGITLSANPSPTVNAGGTVTYTVSLTNTGPSDAANAVYTSTLSANETFLSLSQNSGAAATFNTPAQGTSAPASATVPTLALNATASFTLITRVNPDLPPGSQVVHSAAITSNATDATPNNNTAGSTLSTVIAVDMSINLVQSASTVIAGNVQVYTCSVINNGPSSATDASLSFPLPPNTTFVNASVPSGWTAVLPAVGGTGTVTGNRTLFQPGTAVFAISVRLETPYPTPTITATATVANTRTETDLTNNSASQTANVTSQPTVSIADTSIVEGDVGTVNAIFTVKLSAANSQLVSVDYTTSNGTATAPGQYISQFGTLQFFPGDITKTISVVVNSDFVVEPDMTLFVTLSKPVGTTISQAVGTGTIVNDDVGGSLQFSAASYTVNGNAASAAVTVTRTIGLASAVTVAFNTADDTAVAGADYSAVSTVLTFAGGETSKVVQVPLLNKSGAVPNLQFRVLLSNPTGGATLGTQATATVVLLAAPTITSPLFVSSQVGAAFTYLPTASGQDPLTITLPDQSTLPPGLFFSAGFITGTPTQVGSFSVPIRASNSVGVDLKNLIIEITAVPVPPGGTTLDSDGDGFPDEIEIAASTDPFNFKSTPIGNLPAVILSISNVKLAIKLNFTRSGLDKMTLSGSVTLPPGFVDSGKLVYVDVGGLVRRFALDADGKSKIGGDSIAFKFSKSKEAVPTSQIASFSMKITNATAVDLLKDEGLTNGNFVKVPRTVPVIVMLNTALYTAQQPQVYTAKSGRSGKTKNP